VAEKPVIVIKKKKGGGHGGAHGGAWKVAYADFVTAMMAFFMVMWLMGSDDETKAAIAHYFNHPNTPYKQGRDPMSDIARPLGEQSAEGESVLNGLNGAAPEDMAPQGAQSVQKAPNIHEEIADLLKEELNGSGGMDIDVKVDYLRFSLPEGIFFDAGKLTLSPQGQEALKKLGKIVRTYKGQMTVAAQGDPSSSFEFAMTRAVNVVKGLVEKNYIPDERIKAISRDKTDEISEPEKGPRLEFTLRLKKSGK
jgi:flagellar motor protein MotB